MKKEKLLPIIGHHLRADDHLTFRAGYSDISQERKIFVASNSKMMTCLKTLCLTILVFLTSAFVAYGQKMKPYKPYKTQSNTKTNLYFDTSKTAIIPFNKKKNRFHPFDTIYRATTLTQFEMQIIDSLLTSVVSGYNNYLDEERKSRRIELSKYNYRKQLIVAMNPLGDKEVYVNCFCRTVDSYWKNRWKTELFLVVDGGQCFFDFKINLKSLKVYGFNVNGTG